MKEFLGRIQSKLEFSLQHKWSFLWLPITLFCGISTIVFTLIGFMLLAEIALSVTKFLLFLIIVTLVAKLFVWLFIKVDSYSMAICITCALITIETAILRVAVDNFMGFCTPVDKCIQFAVWILGWIGSITWVIAGISLLTRLFLRIILGK